MQQKEERLEVFKALIESADRNSRRRVDTNVWYASLCTAVLTFDGFLSSLDTSPIHFLALPVCGIALCVLWRNSVIAFRDVSAAKFHYLQEIERKMELQPFASEEKIYESREVRPVTRFESAVPITFGLMFFAALAFSIFTMEFIF
ncbi:MAG: hypothetical protein AAGM21_10170 [Pseudomonadota bacterium]